MSENGQRTALNILIAVPAYKGEIKSLCTFSLMSLVAALCSRGLKCAGHTLDDYDIVTARNLFASLVIQEAALTHLLFIDDDMVFEPTTILKMINADRDVIGCVCPKKSDVSTTPLNVSPDHKPDQPISERQRIGAGLLLIKRTALVSMVDTGKLRKQDRPRTRDIGLTGAVFGFFDRIDRHGLEPLSEDYSFCDRWRGLCNGKVYALFGENIGHIGTKIYR